MASVIDKMTRVQPDLRLSFKPATPAAAVRLRDHCVLNGRHGIDGDGISTRIVGDLGVTETLGNHFFASSGAIATFAEIKANPFEVIHDAQWLSSRGLQRDGEDRFITALVDRLNSPAIPSAPQAMAP